MKQEIINKEGKAYKRVTERTFKKMFINENVNKFLMCSSNVSCMSDFVFHGNGQYIEGKDDTWGKEQIKEYINSFINHFYCYNCQYRELGYYIKYYVEII